MNRDLFWKLAEAEHARAEIFCRRLEGNKDDGDDLYQEVLIKAWGSFDKLRRPESFRPWLYRIIVNLFRSRIRRRRWSGVADKDCHSTERVHDPVPLLDARLNLARAFRGLSVDERAMISLFEIEGWGIAEIARIFEKPEGTIKSRLSRARQKMRRALDRCSFEESKKTSKIGTDYAMSRSETSLE